MNIQLRAWIFWIGLILYVASFFLVAFTSRSFLAEAPGFACAIWAIVIGFGDLRDLITHSGGRWTRNSVELFALLGSGLINPLFFVYAAASPFRPRDRAVRVCRILVPLLIPLCWVVFRYEQFQPRLGHFLWIVGMLLVLLSGYAVHSD